MYKCDFIDEQKKKSHQCSRIYANIDLYPPHARSLTYISFNENESTSLDRIWSNLFFKSVETFEYV